MPESISTLEVMLDDRYRKNKYRHGLWRARVVSTADPENRGRLQVRVLLLDPESEPKRIPVSRPREATGLTNREQVAGLPTVEGLVDVTDDLLIAQAGGGRIQPGASGTPQSGVPDNLCRWAEPAFPFAGPNNGFFSLPQIGDTVWVGFELGHTGKPVWLGAWYGSGELPIEVTDPAVIKLMKTPLGQTLLMDDTAGARKLHLLLSATQSLIFNEAANTITLTQGATIVVLDAANLTVVSSTISLNAAAVSLGQIAATLGVVHDTFLTLYNSHTHNDPVSGVTGPPNQLASAGTHSSAKVKVSV